MALPPTIPTSFVPHPTAGETRRFKVDFIGIFGFIAYAIFFITLVLAIGVFSYEQILVGRQNAKEDALEKQRDKINESVAQELVRLNDRLTASQGLLNNHIAFSNLFRTLNTVLPTTVRFTTLNLTTTEGSPVTLEGTGVARTFNALAAASANFATDGRIKNAIFSRIAVNKNNTVSFTLTASVDQSLLTFSGNNLSPAPSSEPAPQVSEGAASPTP